MSGPRSRLALRLAYDGTDFAGWQMQLDRRTVQGVLQDALASLLAREVRVVGSGRTDAGVHALGQVCHLDDPPEWPLRRVVGALHGRLPPDVRVRGAALVASDFHAMHSARRKTYFYQLHLSDAPGGQADVLRSLPPHRRRTFHAVPARLDLAAMRSAAAHLVGIHDFTTFSKVMPAERGTVRRVHAVRVLRVPRGVRVFVTGEGFLYGMVRLLAGLLVDVGTGRVAAASVPGRLAAADRSLASHSLPARGLFLWSVDYGREGPWGGGAGRSGLLS
ncbi:MAG: tRNA pseudouridine(38-40) synthase TruA [Planctomycetes bacterium]|nr:tRNA pseudouridine(38-40) synthase TruA [Planctomycetota bacterium]